MIMLNNRPLYVGNFKPLIISGIEPTPPGPSFDEVTIGTQTWMAKNLAIDDGGTGIKTTDNVTANGVNFGTQYYYTWDAAMRIANSISGWHLPTQAEWETLVDYAGGVKYSDGEPASSKLRSTSGWANNYNGTDDYGFSVLPVGYIWQSYGPYDSGNSSWLWSSTETSDTGTLYITSMGYENPINKWYLSTSYTSDKSTGQYSVRLIKDT